MRVILRTISSSLLQAWQQLTGNKVRTFLSLLGVSIGIFCIVAVQAAVDSLEKNVVSSLSKLGDETIYVQRFPWAVGGGDYPWWKYLKRPNNTYRDYEALRNQLSDIGQAGLFTNGGARTVKWRNNAVERVGVIGGSEEMSDFFRFEVEQGRNLTPREFDAGTNAVVLGYDVAGELFGNVDPVGREVKLFGRKLNVVGVIEKSGDDLLSVLDFDQAVVVSYNFLKKVLNRKALEAGMTLMARPEEGTTATQLRDQVTLALRQERRIRPSEEDNFSLNNVSILVGALDAIFAVINTVGFVVGIFSIFVGGFSVANIMFVSVQERTNLIGVKMALGAARPVILLEFLLESVVLCLIGGLFGLLTVVLVLRLLNTQMPYEMVLSSGNAILGIGLALAIGVLAGIVPANRASKMDPVEAIRS